MICQSMSLCVDLELHPSYICVAYEFHLSCIKVASFSIQNNFDTLFWYFWILNLFGPCFFLAAKHAYTFHNLTDSLTDRLTISFSIYFWSPTFTIAKLSVNFNWDSLIPNFSSHPPTRESLFWTRPNLTWNLDAI